MIEIDDNSSKFIGFIESEIGMHSYSIELRNNIYDITYLKLDQILNEIFQSSNQLELLYNRLELVSHSKDSFVKEMQLITDELISNQNIKENIQLYYCLTFSYDLLCINLIDQINKLGWEYIHNISDDFNTITMKILDNKGRNHNVDIYFTHNQIDNFRIEHCLPDNIDNKLISSNSIVMNIKDNVIKITDQYSELIDVLNDFDVNTWVIEPNKLTYQILTRRIFIDKYTSIVIDISKSSPLDLCSIKFIGPSDKTFQCQEKLKNNSANWCITKKPRENLETILNIKFPLKSSIQSQDNLIECAICYSYNIEIISQSGQIQIVIPDQQCPFDKCQRNYHKSCLIEWFKSLPNTRNSFGMLYGTCSYCNSSIQVTV